MERSAALHTDCAAVWRVGRREGDGESVPIQPADVADPGSLYCWNGRFALVVQWLARFDRCGADGYMCNGSTPVPSVAGRRQGLAVAGPGDCGVSIATDAARCTRPAKGTVP